MRNLLVIVFVGATLFFYFNEDIANTIPTFQVTNEPVVISKGHKGQTLMLEVTFTHPGFEKWLKSLQAPYPLLVVDSAWIERSASIIEIIQEKGIPTALLGQVSADYVDEQLLTKEIAIYQKYFGKEPLWFMTKDYAFPLDLRHQVFNKRINMLVPTALWEKDLLLENGMFLSVPLHAQSNVDFATLTTELKKLSFISIEENIFGYRLKNKRYP